jgi:hypothetical protein
METLYNIGKYLLISIGVLVFIYIGSKLQMKAWLKVIEDHFMEKFTNIKKDEENGNKEN